MKPRMLMTVFACLMTIDIEKNVKPEPSIASRPNSPSPRRLSPENIKYKSPSPVRAVAAPPKPQQVKLEDAKKGGYQEHLDRTTLVEGRGHLSRLGPAVPRPTAKFRMENSCPLTVDVEKLDSIEKGTHYDPPMRRFFGSPPAQRSRHAELFSSPRLYRNEMTKSATALDQIAKDGGIQESRSPRGGTEERAVQCEAATQRTGTSAKSWNRVSRKSDIFAASVRNGEADTWKNSANGYSRADGTTSPRSGFAAAYEEYANKTFQANRPGIRRGMGGGRVFMAADITNNKTNLQNIP